MYTYTYLHAHTCMHTSIAPLISQEIHISGAEMTTPEVPGLKPSTPYSFSVDASTELGTGSDSSTTTEQGKTCNLK